MSMPDAHTSIPPATLLPDYEAWLERVRMTHDAVAYCCFHRLGRNRVLAEQVGVEVVAGLLARPKVFQYFGLPFSGRVAHLAEAAIARAAQGLPGRSCAWAVLHDGLTGLTHEEQEVVVLTCVEGYDDMRLAAALGCAEERAQRRREAALERLQQLARLALPTTGPAPRRGGRSHG
jgi:hypothetical protein